MAYIISITAEFTPDSWRSAECPSFSQPWLATAVDGVCTWCDADSGFLAIAKCPACFALQGITSDAIITTVRRVLVAEGWKVGSYPLKTHRRLGAQCVAMGCSAKS